MNEAPFMKPALFLVFILISAGLLYSLLLRPLWGFKAPEQQLTAFVTNKAPGKEPSTASPQPYKSEMSEPVAKYPVQEFANNPGALSTAKITEPETVNETITASVFAESLAQEGVATELVEPITPIPLAEPAITTTIAEEPISADVKPIVVEENQPAKPLKKIKSKENKLMADASIKSSPNNVKSEFESQVTPLGESSRQYLNRMNQLLDRELEK